MNITFRPKQKREKKTDVTGLGLNPRVWAKRSDEIWLPEERDDLYNKWFDGWAISHLAAHFGRSPKAIKRQVKIILYSDRASIVQRYKASRARESRKGKRITEREWQYILWHKESHQTPKATAAILARPEIEILRALSKGYSEEVQNELKRRVFGMPLLPGRESRKDKTRRIEKIARALAGMLP